MQAHSYCRNLTGDEHESKILRCIYEGGTLLYLVILKPEANHALKGLFPNMADTVQRYFGCTDKDLEFLAEGMKIPSRPIIIDAKTKKPQEQKGELTIPYALIAFWFHYESELDGKREPIGFIIEHAQLKMADDLGSNN